MAGDPFHMVWTRDLRDFQREINKLRTAANKKKDVEKTVKDEDNFKGKMDAFWNETVGHVWNDRSDPLWSHRSQSTILSLTRKIRFFFIYGSFFQYFKFGTTPRVCDPRSWRSVTSSATTPLTSWSA